MVSPGFIDLHAHGQSARANEFQAHDGVTAALELESGFPLVARWRASRAGKALVHYGVSVAHRDVRTLVLPKLGPRVAAELAAITGDFDASPALPGARLLGRREVLPDDRLPALREGLEQGLREGALGIVCRTRITRGATAGKSSVSFSSRPRRGCPSSNHEPAAMRGAQWLVPLAYGLHVTEEWPHFAAWASRHAFPGFTQDDYAVLHLTGLVVLILLAASPKWHLNRTLVFLVLAFLLLPGLFWNIAFHLGATWFFGVYCPGVLTAVLLYPPGRVGRPALRPSAASHHLRGGGPSVLRRRRFSLLRGGAHCLPSLVGTGRASGRRKRSRR